MSEHGSMGLMMREDGHESPAIGFGPGHEHFAHAPNEQTEVDHLVRATAFYAALVDTFAPGARP